MLRIRCDSDHAGSEWTPEALSLVSEFVSSVHGDAREAGLDSRRSTELTDAVRDRIVELAVESPGETILAVDIRKILAKAGPPKDCVARHLRGLPDGCCALDGTGPELPAQEHPA